MSSSAHERPSERRAAVRTGVVWRALRGVLDEPGAYADAQARVVDLGGGTGGFAVPLAELGHQVLVVDPSPDALAALARRAAESGVTDRVCGVQGDVTDLADVVARETGAEGAVGGADLVLCHGVLGVVDDPAVALAALRGVVRPGGTLSLLVAQRHAAVIARAMAGHFAQARALLEGIDPEGRAGHRFTREQVTALVTSAGLTVTDVHAVRVFADLVPGSLLDLEPGAAQALAELEEAVADRPEYLPLAAQLHLLARR